MVLAFVTVTVRNPSWPVCSDTQESAKGGWGDHSHRQGLIHPAAAQGEDGCDLISGRGQQTSVSKRQTC